MPPVSRLGDSGLGHSCFPPTPITSGSGDVFTNGKPTARLGDPLAPHGCPGSPPHGRSLASGSSTVFVNKRPVVRIGDSISCGGSVGAGSGNVNAGG